MKGIKTDFFDFLSVKISDIHKNPCPIFISQQVYYHVIAVMAFLGLSAVISKSIVRGDEKLTHIEKNVYTFERVEEIEQWLIVNDGVMGGLSQSQMFLTEQGTALFTGQVSLENYGGFASVRTYPFEFGLADYEGITIRVKGDGQNYKLRLKMGANFDGISYQADFSTKAGEWVSISIPFSEFVPVYRGWVQNNAPTLDATRINQLGFMISDKQVGVFSLEIDAIKAYHTQSEAQSSIGGKGSNTFLIYAYKFCTAHTSR